LSQSRSTHEPKNYSGFIALAAFLLFLTIGTLAGLTNKPLQGEPTPTMQPRPVDISLRVLPENCRLSGNAPGVKIESSIGTCRLTIQREPNPFIVVRTKMADDYSRTSPLNTADQLIVDFKREAVIVLNDLPHAELDAWKCGFEVAPTSIGEDNCDSMPLLVSYN